MKTVYHNIIVIACVVLTTLFADMFGFFRNLNEVLMLDSDPSGMALLFVGVAFCLPFIIGLLIGMVASYVAGTHPKRNQ